MSDLVVEPVVEPVVETVSLGAIRAEACRVRGRRVEIEVGMVSEASFAVRVMDRRRARFRVCSAERVHAVALELAAELREDAAPKPARFAGDGLSSDYWWKDYTVSQREAARRWVRLVLLNLPHQSGHDTDRFIASLDPPKVEDLVKRAVEGRGAEGF